MDNHSKSLERTSKTGRGVPTTRPYRKTDSTLSRVTFRKVEQFPATTKLPV